MGGLFSKSKKKRKSQVSDLDRSILSLKIQKDQLALFRKKLETQYIQAEESAKTYVFQSFTPFMLHQIDQTRPASPSASRIET